MRPRPLIGIRPQQAGGVVEKEEEIVSGIGHGRR
jgi:hypothetical protein